MEIAKGLVVEAAIEMVIAVDVEADKIAAVIIRKEMLMVEAVVVAAEEIAAAIIKEVVIMEEGALVEEEAVFPFISDPRILIPSAPTKIPILPNSKTFPVTRSVGKIFLRNKKMLKCKSTRVRQGNGL